LKLRLIAFIVFFITATSSFGHEYFFAFAEVEYNEISRKFEATLIVSTHDLEIILKEKNNELGDLKHVHSGTNSHKVLQAFLMHHFSIKCGEELPKMKLIGHEVTLEGTTNFYLESEPIALNSALEITFDLLMNEYEKQQNKLTLYVRDNSYTRPFVHNTRKQTIKLETK